MNRLPVIIVATLAVAVTLFVGGSYALFHFALLWSMAGPDPVRVLEKAQPVGDQIATALEEHHRRHGRYPSELDDLVRTGLLTTIQTVPTHWGTSSQRGPVYEYNAAIDLFRLHFGYRVEGGIGPGKFYSRSLTSGDSAGWCSGRTPEAFENVVAERILAGYRRDGDARSLSLFMSEVIAQANPDYLYRDRVVDWLGKAEGISLPPEIQTDSRKGHSYRSKEDSTHRYVFVYKDHWLPLMKSLLPAGTQLEQSHPIRVENADTVDKNYPVLDRLLLLENSGDRMTWKILRECPKSRWDKPSGRYALVRDSDDKPN